MNDDQNMTAEARVARGVAWLDKNVPQWWDKIELKTLDMKDGCRCVIGQLGGGVYLTTWNTPFNVFFDGYAWRERRELLAGTALANVAPPASRALAVAGGLVRPAAWFGFDADTDHLDFDDLQAEWKRMIAARKAAAVVA